MTPWLDQTPPMPEGHDATAADLAGYLRYRLKRPMMTWQNVTFSVSDCIDLDWIERMTSYERRHAFSIRTTFRDCRPDVVALRAAPLRIQPPTVYEVKVTRSDFLSDVRAGKWRAYLRIAGSVYFATPDKLLDPREVPEECGLIVRRKTHWRVLREAPVHGWQPADSYWMTLLMRDRDPMSWEIRQRERYLTGTAG